jgi:hypothetical protein
VKQMLTQYSWLLAALLLLAPPSTLAGQSHAAPSAKFNDSAPPQETSPNAPLASPPGEEEHTGALSL